MQELDQEGREQHEMGKHQQQNRSEHEIKGWGRRTRGVEPASHKLNETQHEEEGESGDETRKEQTNQPRTNKRKQVKEKRTNHNNLEKECLGMGLFGVEEITSMEEG